MRCPSVYRIVQETRKRVRACICGMFQERKSRLTTSTPPSPPLVPPSPSDEVQEFESNTGAGAALVYPLQVRHARRYHSIPLSAPSSLLPSFPLFSCFVKTQFLPPRCRNLSVNTPKHICSCTSSSRCANEDQQAFGLISGAYNGPLNAEKTCYLKHLSRGM